MACKYRVTHNGLKPNTILDFDDIKDAMDYAELTIKAIKIAGCKIRTVDIKPIYTTRLSDDEDD